MSHFTTVQGVIMESLNGLSAVTVTSEGIYDAQRKCNYFAKWMPGRRGEKVFVLGDQFSEHVIILSTEGHFLGNADREVPLKGRMSWRGTHLVVKGVQCAY